VASCASALEAFRIVSRQRLDLMFLDIQMPELSGLDFLRSLRNPPKVILTTAHRKFALEGFELDVVDYLLKPIRLERFLKAIEKFKESCGFVKNAEYQKNRKLVPDHINVKADRKIYKVSLEDILYIESEGDYVKITTPGRVIMSKQTISSMEKELPGNRFVRIHRSTIIAIDKIESFDATMIEIKKRQFPIGRNYSNIVMKILKA